MCQLYPSNLPPTASIVLEATVRRSHVSAPAAHDAAGLIWTVFVSVKNSIAAVPCSRE